MCVNGKDVHSTQFLSRKSSVCSVLLRSMCSVVECLGGTVWCGNGKERFSPTQLAALKVVYLHSPFSNSCTGREHETRASLSSDMF
jgi:hypothetical protein